MDLSVIVGGLGSFLTIEAEIRNAVQAGSKFYAVQKLKKNCGTPNFLSLPEELAFIADKAEGYLFRNKTDILGKSLFTPEEKSEFIEGFFQTHTDALPYQTEIEEILSNYINQLESYLLSQLSVGEKLIYQTIRRSVENKKQVLTSKIESSSQDILHAIDIPPLTPYNLGTPNKLFYGRIQKIDDILQMLWKDHLVFLSGLGGIGKSQIARKIAFQSQDRYKLIMWFSANTETEILREFNNAAIFYHLIQEERDDFDYVKSKLSAFIDKCSTSLIIYDGADDIALNFLTEKCFFPHSDIIVTTQNSNIDSDAFSVLPIDSFIPEEARSFLMERSNNRKRTEQDPETISTLCDILENFPLALEYARAYVNETQVSFADYIKIYKEHKYDIFKGPVSKYEKTAYTAWKISYDKILQRSASAKAILNVLSLLDTHDIPFSDIFITSGQYPLYEWNQILQTIKGYSLITIHDNFADIHGLTQEFIRLQMRDAQEFSVYYEKTLQLFINLMPDRITNSKEKDFVNRLMKHSIRLTSYNCNFHDQNVVRFATDIVSKLYVLGYYKQTITFIQTQLELYSYAAENVQLLQQITFLAQAYHYTGEDRFALDLLSKYGHTVLSSEGLTDLQKNQLLSRYKNVEGIIQKDQGRISDCLKTFDKALGFLKNLSPDSDREMECNILINMGVAHKRLSKYRESLSYYGLARLYADHSKHLLLRIYGNMAEAYAALGCSDAEFQYFEVCLTFSIEVGDKRNECICLRNLGNYYMKQYQYNQAENRFEESLKIAEEIRFFIGIADAYCKLGDVAFVRGNIPEAKDYWKLSLEKSCEINYKDGISSARKALCQLERPCPI